MKRWALYVLIVVGLVLGVWGGNYYWQGTPRCSLYRMAKAIKNNDPQTFLCYVDMDQVFEGIVDSTIKNSGDKKSPDSDSAASGPEEPSGSDKKFKNMIAQVAKALRPALEKQAIRAINNMDPDQRDRISPFAFAFLSEVKQEGNKAEVTVRASKKDRYQGTMEKTSDGFWKIVKLDMDFFQMLKKRESIKIRTIKPPTGTGPLTLILFPAGRGLNKKTSLALEGEGQGEGEGELELYQAANSAE